MSNAVFGIDPLVGNVIRSSLDVSVSNGAFYAASLSCNGVFTALRGHLDSPVQRRIKAAISHLRSTKAVRDVVNEVLRGVATTPNIRV